MGRRRQQQLVSSPLVLREGLMWVTTGSRSLAVGFSLFSFSLLLAHL